MWIRSQNREILINSKRLFVNEVVENKKIVGYSIDSGGIELGRFSTKSKALKVFDMIQYHINKPMRLCNLRTGEQYRYAKGDFVITPANSVEDLINESKGLNHCVKTYATKYSKGETAIFLVRKKDDVLTSFYTLELKDGQVHQIRGKNNCDPTDKVKDFVDKWAKKFKIKPLVHQGF